MDANFNKNQFYNVPLNQEDVYMFRSPEEERALLRMVDETERMTEEEKANYFRLLKR